MNVIRATLCLSSLCLLTACASNLANVRTLATSMQTATQGTSSLAAADEEACADNAALQQEYISIEAANGAAIWTPPPCALLHAVLESLLAENKALEAYASALNSIAANQFATTTTDAADITGTLQALNHVPGPVVSAVGAVFSTIETAVLDGYRQRQLKNVMNDATANAFGTIVTSYSTLAMQYKTALGNWGKNIDLISRDVAHDHESTEPVAVAEFQLRLAQLKQSLNAKGAAVSSFADAIGKLEPAYDAASKDLRDPNPKEIYTDVKAFATQVKNAHDKLIAAFGHT